MDEPKYTQVFNKADKDALESLLANRVSSVPGYGLVYADLLSRFRAMVPDTDITAI